MDTHNLVENIPSQNPNVQNIDHEDIVAFEEQQEIPQRGNKVIIEEHHQMHPLQEEGKNPSVAKRTTNPPIPIRSTNPKKTTYAKQKC